MLNVFSQLPIPLGYFSNPIAMTAAALNSPLAVAEIPLWRLGLASLPCVLIIVWMLRQELGGRRALQGLARMLGQLLVVGYFLTYLFQAESLWVLLLVTTVMTLVSAWISTGSFSQKNASIFFAAALAIGVAGFSSLVWILVLVLQIPLGTHTRTAIPIAGMVFSTAMNSVSVAGERFYSECQRNTGTKEAARMAFTASMIPTTNSLFAVGVVSIPGMMTGQILSGVDPTIAARYQIMVMLMLFGASGTAAILFLNLAQRFFDRSSSTQTVT